MQYHYIHGQTPLDQEETHGLIPHVVMRGELDEWEEENILAAREWVLRKRTLSRHELLSTGFILTLHQRMFGNVWQWAGSYRRSDKNIGVPFYEVDTALRQLLDDAQYWRHHESYPLRTMAVVLHHRLVKIHLFPNGNGRHARLYADAMVAKHGATPLTWGGGDLSKPEALRRRYIAALRAADGGDYEPLITFAT